MNMLPGSHDNQMLLYINISVTGQPTQLCPGLCEKVIPRCPVDLWNAAVHREPGQYTHFIQMWSWFFHGVF